MVISREEVVKEIVNLLQPASLPEDELAKSVLAEIDRKAEEDGHFDYFHGSSSLSTRNRRERLGLIEEVSASATNFLRSLDALAGEDRAVMFAYLKQSGVVLREEFYEMLKRLIEVAEQQKIYCSLGRSGGAIEARADMDRKKICAIFALSLLRTYHTGKISRGCRRYLDITAVLIEHFEPLETSDVRRACEEMFNLLCAHEQDDR
ncbi:hypothetical protein FV228_00330 [Methylobacterium sp. WL18]|uniref:hypothetical protein n=1 Tax=Methylobacterium sp. WL18 TaxID=2603897 RepID=UPI0011C8BD2C|nr:hypothetical protein [Methylobacterium sp. WL18]TXN76444.1 hypothetical protein FV228_00330 [Methylobacterium sp. WL18]